MHQGLSRRALLAGGAGAAATLMMNGLVPAQPATAPAAYPNRFHRDGGLVIIPDKGELYVASDFHTRHKDFQQWLDDTQLLKKLKDREDVYGVIVGDAVDEKFNDAQAEKDGDTKIIERIREIQADGEAGKRFLFFQGNHEYEVVRIYEAIHKDEKIRQQIGPLDEKKFKWVVRAIFNGPNGLHFQQFNFLERITPQQYEFLKGLPVAVLVKNGLVLTHAGPAQTAQSPQSIVKQEKQVVEETLWPRPVEVQPEGGYSKEHVDQFLKVMENSGLLIVGHTPLGGLPQQWLRDGFGVYGKHQIIMATSYGSEPGEKTHFAIDLSKRYNSEADVAVKEIRRLGGKQP